MDKNKIGKVAVHWQNDKYGMRATVYPFGDETHDQRFGTIDVSRRQHYKGEWEPAEVNWSAMGSQEPEVAKAYGKGLIKATEIAEEMNWPVVHFKATITIKEEGQPDRTITEVYVGTHYKQIENEHTPVGITIDKVEQVD